MWKQMRVVVKYGFIFIFFFLFMPDQGRAYIVDAVDGYTIEQLEADLKGINKQFKNNITIKQIGTSHFYQPIWAIKLGKGEESILLIGAHHGREWISSNLLMVMLERYADAYQHKKKIGKFDSNIFDKISIWFVPMLNPDGVDIQQGKLPVQNKRDFIFMNDGSLNFKRWKASGIGIDLNRQYPSGWQDVPGSPFPSYKGYKGKRPFEAKEVQAVVRFIEEINPMSAIAYHSSGQEIFWQYGARQNIVRDYFLATKLAELTGYSLSIPPEEANGGGFTDWFIEEYGKPAFTLELTDFHQESNPPIRKLWEEWRRNRLVGIYLASEMANWR
ncbi:carboxypeptidase [Caldibacillus thermoamylovorans]|nr:carboxypeptidase [Caldibacillus thermoamylovorans]